MTVTLGEVTARNKACLQREFHKLKRKRLMPQKQKVAVALNVCKVGRKK